MPSIHDSYLGLAEETTYGTAVAPARFLEMVSEGISGKYERINSDAYRAGQRVLHKDRFAPNPKGAEGDIKIEGQDGSLGLLLKHALGAVTSGAPDVDGFTTHTVTVADLAGLSLTVQVGRVDTTGTLHPFTYEGGKIKSFEFGNAVDGVLNMTFDFDFSKETIGAGTGAYAAATPTYNTTSQLFTFVGGQVDIGGTAFGVSDITLKGDNKLKTDRWSTAGKREPLEEGHREYTFELKGEFEGLAHVDRVAALVASDTLASVELKWASPQGGELVVSIPYGRFDEGPVNFDGAKIPELALKGMAVWDGSTSPVTITYKSKDVAP